MTDIFSLTVRCLKPKSDTRPGLIEDEDRAADDVQSPAANDNGNREAQPRFDAAILRIARLIGRQMARQEFERLNAANDNHPPERFDD
jgi:hypothetical protein